MKKINNSIIKKSNIIIFLIACIFSTNNMLSITNQASPANWLYPDGNVTATRNIIEKSYSQSLDSMVIKWTTRLISGDIQPLVGNIINNTRINSNFPFAPNEIAAVSGGKLVVVDGRGRVKELTELPNFVNSVSVLIDTLETSTEASSIFDVREPVIMGLESIENAREDSLAFTYIAGIRNSDSTVQILKRLALDMRPYNQNIHASIRPVFGKKNGNTISIYASININRPTAPDTDPVKPPFFRGITQFDGSFGNSNYPYTNLLSDIDNRVHLGYEASFAQPSIDVINNRASLIIPSYPTNGLDVNIDNGVSFPTNSKAPYIFGLDISGSFIDEAVESSEFSMISGTRPQVRMYYVNLFNERVNAVQKFMLIAENYNGLDGSDGTAQLHLADEQGAMLTFPNDPDYRPFIGGKNHNWAVAVGNVDGNNTNTSLPHFPNNMGNEIILTQTTKDFSYPQSKLMIMRYYYNNGTQITNPIGDPKFELDTIVGHKINGWVAAVADLDNAPDGKDEIILADNSKLIVLRMKDYSNFDFVSGHPFDTLMIKEFPNELISSAIVSDLDGDGKHDIIVTTHERTYIIGAPLSNLITLNFPPDKNGVSTITYCAGDSVNFNWDNNVVNAEAVTIKFMDIQTGELLTIIERIDNSMESTTATYITDTTLIGRVGHFMLTNSDDPNFVLETSTTMTFNNPLVDFDIEGDISSYKIGSEVKLNITTSCIDSLGIEYSLDGLDWIDGESEFSPDTVPSRYTLLSKVPCVSIFNPTPPDIQDSINFRILTFKDGLSYISSSFSVKVEPAILDVKTSEIVTADPNKEFIWNSSNFNYLCDSLDLSISLDNGVSFNLIETINGNSDKYLWQVPLNIQEDVIFRFYCRNSCMREDLELKDITPKLLNIVAPNPFTAGSETLEIIYTVPENLYATVQIFDQANRLVKVITENEYRQIGTAYTDKWEGEIHSGGFAAMGMYYVKVEFSNGISEIYPIFVRK